MGVDVTSYVIAGIKMQEDDLYLETTKRGCEHKIIAPKAKFCPECGKPTWEQDRTPRPQLDEYKETFCGFRVLYGGIDDYNITFIGQKIAILGGYDDDDFAKKFDIDPVEHTALIGKMKTALEPLNLWREQDFGLWLVQVVSY